MWKRKRIKQALSLIGATIIFGTFIARDARKDQLKELADSIQAAENQFHTQAELQKLYSALIRLQDSFQFFTQRFDKPKAQSSYKPRWDDLGWVESDYANTKQLLTNASRLREKLSGTNKKTIDTEALQQKLEVVNKKLNEVRERFNEADANADEIADATNAQKAVATLQLSETVRSINEDLDQISNKLDRLTGDIERASNLVLKTAEQELQTDELNYQWWTFIYYTLYSVGWVVTLAGTLIGEPEEKSVIEELTEA